MYTMCLWSEVSGAEVQDLKGPRSKFGVRGGFGINSSIARINTLHWNHQVLLGEQYAIHTRTETMCRVQALCQVKVRWAAASLKWCSFSICIYVQNDMPCSLEINYNRIVFACNLSSDALWAPCLRLQLSVTSCTVSSSKVNDKLQSIYCSILLLLSDKEANAEGG